MSRPANWAPTGIKVAVAMGWGAGVALVAAVLAAGPVVLAHGYWAAGYHRLSAMEIVGRFDRWVGPGMMVAVGLWVGWAWVTGARPGAASAGRSARDERWARVAGVLVLSFVCLARLAVAIAARRADGAANVVLISIDTLRADRLGAYGYPHPTSPVIDARLAAAGAVFEQCYSQSPKTTPSHMTMLTSLFPCVHGVALWEGAARGAVLNPAVHTLAEVLKNAGYATGAFTGRGHVHRSRGFGQGFDVYVHRQRYEHALPGERGGHLERALAWMEARRGRRFFLFFHTYAVHDPYVPPVESAAYFDDGTYRGPVRAAVERLRADRTAWADAHRVFWDSVDQANPDDVRFVGRLYDGGIRDMDGHVVASILDRLDRMGVADDSLVVLTSDHGEAFGEHGRFLHGDLYGETLRVPLVLRFPGRVRAGMRVEAPVRLVDVMPTILDLVGVPAPAVLQGQSVAGYLDGDPARAGAVTDVPSEFSSPADGRVFESMRRGSLTYIVDRADERLFDREADPDEHRDVAAAQPAALGAMRASLATWRDECARLGRRFGPRDEVGPSAATTEQLRALGYVR